MKMLSMVLLLVGLLTLVSCEEKKEAATAAPEVAPIATEEVPAEEVAPVAEEAAPAEEAGTEEAPAE